jgi:Fic family protein
VETGAFKQHQSGRLTKTPEGYWAYVPNPLPPNIEWDQELVSALAGATLELGRLAGVGQTLLNPHLLINPLMRREAVLSSRIEGTQASLSDLFFFEAAPSAEPRTPDVREVANYVRALELGLEHRHTLPISVRLLRELHEKLLEGVRGEHLTPGEVRRSQNWIGPPGCTLNEATFVPPPPAEMKEALGALEKYLHAPSGLPPLIRLALVHYQFEAIHPFLDGNGRIGRLLMALLLCVDDLLPQPLLYLSAYFEKHRQEYYDHLLRVSQTGHWRDWIVFFLRGVKEQASDAVQRSNDLLRLRDNYRKKCQVARGSALLSKLVDALFDIPVTTASSASRALGVTFRSAQKSINYLIKVKILKEVTGKQRNRVYLAEGIVQVIDAPGSPHA